MTIHFKPTLAGILLTALCTVPSNAATSSTRPAYGCFKVSAADLNIRMKPYGNSPVVAAAKQGQMLIKRKRFCNFRGYFCAVATTGGVEGYADKNFMTVAPCPAESAVTKKS